MTWFRNLFNHIVCDLQDPTNVAIPSKLVFEVVNVIVETLVLSHVQASWL
jgi:hypothetical protein